MRNGELLSKMIMRATERHAGQFDLGGQPYILHSLKVMHYLKSDDEELNCIAVGHDLIEDTGDSYEALAKDFGHRIACGIYLLSRQPEQSEWEYRICVKSCEDTILVKMADLRHNSDMRRLRGVTEKDVRRMVRYHEFYLELETALCAANSQQSAKLTQNK